MRKYSKPELSIIIPVYNAEPFLGDCFESIWNQQTEVVFEVILVDDGSTDNSYLMCVEESRKAKNIKVLRQENGGPAKARNTGIKKARGELILFLDADDVLCKDSLENLMSAYKCDPVDVLVGDGVRDYGLAGRKILPIGDWQDGFTFRDRDKIDLLIRKYVSDPNSVTSMQVVWGKLFRTDFLKKNRIYFNEAPRAWEDIEFMFDVLMNVKSIRYCKLPVSMSFRRVRECISYNNCVCHYHTLNYVMFKMYSDLHKAGFQDAEKLFWEGYTTWMVTTLYKLHQYIRPKSFLKVLSASKEILFNRMLRKHIDAYDPEKNKNWKIFRWLLKNNHPWMILAVFWLQSRFPDLLKRRA